MPPRREQLREAALTGVVGAGLGEPGRRSIGFLKRSDLKSHQIEPSSQRTSRQHNAKRPIGIPFGGAFAVQGLGWTVQDVKGQRDRSHRYQRGARVKLKWMWSIPPRENR